MKRILVTGANGFCGRHLCAALRESRAAVFGTCRSLPAFPHTRTVILRPKAEESETGILRGVYPECSAQDDKVRLVSLDITNQGEVDALIRKLRPDGVYHLAAQCIPRQAAQDPDRTFAVNAAAVIYLLDALRRYAPSARVLLASTVQVYGQSFNRRAALEEKDLVWPLEPYAASKAVAELAALEMVNRFKVPVIIARAFNHVGPGQGPGFVLSDWCRQIAQIEAGRRAPVLKVGALDNRRGFLAVSDVVRAYRILMERGRPGQIYNVGGGETYSLEELLRFLLKKAFVKIDVRVEAARVRRNVPRLMRVRDRKMRALGWRPVHSVPEALEALLNEWRRKVKKGSADG